MVEAFSALVNFAKNDEWGLIGETLSPEVHQLVTQWDTIPSDQRGELAGYALGKNGTDILVPGALAKVAAKSVKSAKELAAVCKNLSIANETLVLETAAGMGNSAKVGEIVEAGQRTAKIADELGFTGREMGQLKQAGKLEGAVAESYEHLSLSMKESMKLFSEAGEKLHPYQGIYMPEFRVREIIHSTGIPTFPRPRGIPETYRVKISDRGAGMLYIHPEHTHTSIRVMPGKPHSPLPHQQKPYVIYRKNGETFDLLGNAVDSASPKANIPIELFVFKD